MFVTMVRTILIYIIIVAGLRIMGKRQLGELQPSELVVTIMVSNIATLSIEDTNVPLLGGVIPILTLVCFEVFMSFVTLKSRRARTIISGSPRMLIKDGVLIQSEMKNLRFSIDDLMEELRTNNVFDIRDIAFAIVETNGKLSIYQDFNKRNVTPEMLNIQPKSDDNAPPVVIISDGEVIEQSLVYCNLKREWLDKVLKQNGYTEKEVFLMTCDRHADYHIVKKDKKQT